MEYRGATGIIMININNILTQLNAKMAADIADSYNIPELVKRVQAYQKLNVDAGTVPEYSSYNELPDSDSANIGQIVYVRQQPANRLNFSNRGRNAVKDSAGTFFFGKKVDTNTIGWQKIPLLQGDSDYADIEPEGYTFQGTVSGYTVGGDKSSPGQPWFDEIDKFSFSSDGDATDVGDLTSKRGHGLAGQTSLTHGYAVGGRVSTNDPDTNIIEKYSFSADGNATDVGDLTTTARYTTGQSSENHGYRSSGSTSPGTIDKHTFAVDANATDVGDMSVSRWGCSGQSSTTHGYNSGGNNTRDIIDKFPFATDENATDVGDMTTATNFSSGQSSTTHGYNCGGSPAINTIDKFSFTSDGNATDVGDLPNNQKQGMGQSSTTSGYSTGGNPQQNYIYKFPFASDGNASDVGNLTVGRAAGADAQV